MTTLLGAEGRTYLVAADRSAIPARDDWEAAFESGDLLRLRSWFVRNCRPRVPLRDRTPLTGEIVVNTQAQADALVGRRIVGGNVRLTASNIYLHDFWIFGGLGAGQLVQVSPGVEARISHLFLDALGNPVTGHGIGGPVTAKLLVENISTQNINDGIRMLDGSTYRHIYAHDPISWNKVGGGVPYDPAKHPHSDGMQGVKGSFSVTRSFLDMPPTAGPNVVSCMILNASAGPIDGVEVSESYFNGGGYTFRMPATTYGVPTNVTIRDNLFGVGHGSAYGLWGIDDPSQVRRYGNRWIRSRRPVYLTTGAVAKPIDW